MREKNRKPIANNRKRLPQFTTMNVIDGQAGLIICSSLIFYSLTIDNILNIIVLLILAGVTISALSGDNGILIKATEAKKQTEIEGVREEAEVAKQGVLSRNLGSGKDATREEIIKGIVEEIGGTAEGNLITTEDGKYEIMVKEDNSIEVVEKGKGYIDAETKEQAPESDFRWTTLADGTVRIYEYLGTETSLHIPDMIDGKTVTIIKMDKTNAGDSSNFVEGGKLSQNKIAFKSVKIPEGVTFIGDRAFMNNQATGIQIPSTVTTIEEGAFTKNNLEEIIYGRTETGEEDKTIINSYAGRSAGEIKIPEGVKEIDSWAFSSVGLTSIEIPEGVITIRGGAFVGENLQKLIIPSTIKNVSPITFNFTNIEYVEFKGNTFSNALFAISAQDRIEKIVVPYSEDHSVLEYYKGLIESKAINGTIGTIVEKEI